MAAFGPASLLYGYLKFFRQYSYELCRVHTNPGGPRRVSDRILLG